VQLWIAQQELTLPALLVQKSTNTDADAAISYGSPNSPPPLTKNTTPGQFFFKREQEGRAQKGLS
jgi:hypothetical protein